MLKYRMTVRYSDEDQAFIAEAPELPGCMADGPTPEQAVTALQTVMALWIAVAREDGRPIPEPDLTRKP